MELDEMKSAWQTLDRHMARQHEIHLQLYRESRLDKLRHGLRPLLWGQWVQLALGVALLLAGVAFWSTHRWSAGWIACGIVTQAFGILVVAFSARVVSLIQGIDYASPVLEIQHRLATLRQWRVRVEAPVFATLGSFIWVPLVLMWFQQMFDGSGGDLLKVAPGLAFSLTLAGAVSLVLTWGTYGVLRYAGKRAWLERNFVGRSLLRAEAMMDEVRRFEQP